MNNSGNGSAMLLFSNSMEQYLRLNTTAAILLYCF